MWADSVLEVVADFFSAIFVEAALAAPAARRVTKTS
jgi:hypothetical protein